MIKQTKNKECERCKELMEESEEMFDSIWFGRAILDVIGLIASENDYSNEDVMKILGVLSEDSRNELLNNVYNYALEIEEDYEEE